MFKLAVIGTVAAAAYATHPVNDQLIGTIKRQTSLWNPAEVHENPFANYTEEQLQGLLGTIIAPPRSDVTGVEVTGPNGDSYDFRNKFPQCNQEIRDQQSCGSCWAFGAAEALEDRLCIATGQKVRLSTQDMVSCDKSNYACDGGYLNLAWSYLQRTGVATEQCTPYVSGNGKVPACPSKCNDGSAIKKYKCKDVLAARGPAQIKTLIEQSGPVETGFTVYNDFFNYKSGIYHHTSGGVAGGHAVKIVGWGVEGSTKYWICANSWGKGWGEAGYFRIKEGDSGIDSTAYGCNPALTTLEEYF